MGAKNLSIYYQDSMFLFVISKISLGEPCQLAEAEKQVTLFFYLIKMLHLKKI